MNGVLKGAKWLLFLAFMAIVAGCNSGGSPEKNDKKLVSIQITPTIITTKGASSLKLAKGNHQKLTAIGYFNDGSHKNISEDVNWFSSNQSVINFLSDSVVGSDIGVATVTAQQGDIVSNDLDVEVTDAVMTSLHVTPAVASIHVGNGQKLTATATYSDATTADISDQVSWVSEDSAIVTISSSGFLSSQSTGATEVHASINGMISNRVLVEVNDAAIVSIQITPLSLSLAKNNTSQLSVLATYSDSRTENVSNVVSWSTEDSAIMSVSNTGLVTGLKPGNTKVSASLSDITSNDVDVSVTDATIKTIHIRPEAFSVAKGNTIQLSAVAKYSDDSIADISHLITWSSMDTSTATISTTGLLTGVGIGNTEVTASRDTLRSNVAVAVTNAEVISIDVTPEAPTLIKGTALPLNAMATYSDQTTADITSDVSWSADDTSVATVTSEGVITGLEAGASIITAQLDDIYSNSVNVTVTDPLVSVTVCGNISGKPFDRSLGGGINDSDKTNATGNCLKIREINDTTDGKVKWFTSSPSLAVVNGLGYTINDGKYNSGDTYARAWVEKREEYGPAGTFALFRQDGQMVAPPGWRTDEVPGTNGQFDRWCQKLSAITFANHSDWRRPTLKELSALFEYDNENNLSMYERFGWPAESYWSATKGRFGYLYADLNTGVGNIIGDISPDFSISVSCVSVSN
ncbi:Ig-like domain-containing protein [Photobacterium sp. J15]|uniref:Ig-like domain-containing protein n=1 Tax=Photobacterium sp. J15 TaxID=265901 RepID=UPI0007E4AA58|nr:Ig-like domain-containing protein [Photobacterium sp. J15]